MPKHFGYGSNIGRFKMWADMRRPVGDANVLETPIPVPVVGKLPRYRLAVRSNGTATIVPGAATDFVLGLVYDLTDDQIGRLRRSEGVGQNDPFPIGEVVQVEDEAGAVIPNVHSWKCWPESCDTEQPVAKYYFELIAESLILEMGNSEQAQEYVRNVIEPLLRRKRIGVNIS